MIKNLTIQKQNRNIKIESRLSTTKALQIFPLHFIGRSAFIPTPPFSWAIVPQDTIELPSLLLLRPIRTAAVHYPITAK